MFDRDAGPENKIGNISSLRNKTAKNSGEPAKYQESPKSLAKNSADSHIS